jgi:hypothetical protein
MKEKSPIILTNGGLGIFKNHKLKTTWNPIPIIINAPNFL